MKATAQPPVMGAEPRSEEIDHYGPDPRETGWYALVEAQDSDTGSRAEKARFWTPWKRGILGVLASAMVAAGALLQKAAPPAPVDPDYGKQAEAGRILTEEVKHAVAGYFGARNIEERLAFVCDPERVRPLMVDHEVSHPLSSRKVVRVEVHATMTRFPTRHPHVFASVVDSQNKVSVAILRQYGERVKIDWEAQEAYNPLDITNVVRLHPSGDSILRVMARPSDYYNFEFIDQSQWQAFVLWNPNEPKARLHGYCRRGGEVCQSLLDLTAGGHAVAARVAVGFSAQLNGDDTVEIREMVAPHWFGGDA